MALVCLKSVFSHVLLAQPSLLSVWYLFDIQTIPRMAQLMQDPKYPELVLRFIYFVFYLKHVSVAANFVQFNIMMNYLVWLWWLLVSLIEERMT